ncbi:MAG: PQQ-dependent sugar dehydrogenase [Gammaproteobacteria bacterium]|jgi:glucose/arabinose dehydrogenase
MRSSYLFIFTAAALTTAALMSCTTASAQATGGQSYEQDAPGRVHRIDLAALPEPYATDSARNFPMVVPRPDNAELHLPPGFEISVLTRDVEGPRVMRIAPNGDIFVSESRAGRVRVLRPSNDGASVTSNAVFAEGLTRPFGLQFYPAGADPQWLYVAEMNRVVRYPYRVGDTQARGEPEVVVEQLAPTENGHYSRDLVFSPDGRRMFVAVGSLSNVAADMPQKSPEEIEAWEAEHGLGAAWGDETNRATVLVFDVGSDAPGRLYATGIRNCVGLSIEPVTGDVWCTVNERDALGDNLVPDYSTRVRPGAFYGWPWYYMGDNEDPRHAGERPDLAGKVTVPDVPFESHSAAVGLEFYTENSGPAAFPEEYVGDGFAVFHGSWNKEHRTGHKIVRIPMENGLPSGEYIDFLVGFVTDDGEPWARPASVTQASDGSLLMSDDGGNVIYRISY